jgi:hypothetical protein
LFQIAFSHYHIQAVIPFHSIAAISKENVMLIIPSGISIKTHTAQDVQALSLSLIYVVADLFADLFCQLSQQKCNVRLPGEAVCHLPEAKRNRNDQRTTC